VVTFIVKGNSDEAFHAAIWHKINGFSDIREVKSIGCYTVCEAPDTELDKIASWYCEWDFEMGNAPIGALMTYAHLPERMIYGKDE